MSASTAQKRDWLAAAAVLTLLLVIAFAPVVFGQRHLMLSAWDAPSIMQSGAYDPIPRPAAIRVARTTDPGAPAWQNEPWFKLISGQYWSEFALPLWNPYNAFGTPLAASAQPQPFFPLAMLLSFHVTAWTYSLFILARLLLGGLLSYFFARQFLTQLPALFAGITFMLSGYFMLLLNMPHVSVEVLTPGLFLAFEILARRNSWAAASGIAAIIFLISTGGMPESMFLTGSFGGLYFVCRVSSDTELRACAGSLFTKLFVAITLGFALSAFVLLPFAEFVRVAFDSHRTLNAVGGAVGLGYDRDFTSTIQYLLPLIFGPPLASVFENLMGRSGLRGYWGILPFFFAVMAVLFVCLRRRSALKHETFLTVFFSITLVLMVLKRFGNPVINWIGVLPLSELVVYPKYLEPLIAFCVAMLAGVGFSILIERRAPSRLFVLAAVVVVAAMLVTAGPYLPLVLSPDLKFAKFFYFSSMALGITVVIGIALLCVIGMRPAWRPWLARGFIGLLSVELLSNFILPCFYLIGSFPPARADPYAGAPYIGFIKGLDTDYSRVFAREGLLYPNWSSAFELADVRSLDALHYERYRRFMRSFLLPPGGTRTDGDLFDRFTGTGFPYAFETEPERRFLALSSVKYLISSSKYAWPKQIYAGEALVYEVPDVLPRAALFHSIEILPDDAVLARLQDPAFNPHEQAVVSRESVTRPDEIAALTAAAPAVLSAARIVNYRSQYVAIEADTPAPALLVLNDTNYSGWRAYLNGQPAEMLSANYLFRGVLLPAGKSVVEFKYQPRSFQIGGGISLAAFAILAVLVLRERRSARRLITV